LELTLGFSPCPNDTFIFDALVHQKINTTPYTFNYIMDDVETLNQWAVDGKLAITKMSFAASCSLQKQYALLESGAALGKGVGPLLIAKHQTIHTSKAIVIALPGEKTTAHFLFNYYNKINGEKVFMPFHEIENWVIAAPENETRLGVIIHENRFTYREKGLFKIQDLGEYWETKTGLPIPLGGIFMQTHFDASIQKDITNLIRQSVAYAFANYKTSLPSFVTDNAQEMSEAVMWQHIRLYVNDSSLHLCENEMEAINLMRKLISP
jgi:1,4-dihydroxy-6-naphthoate synthase